MKRIALTMALCIGLFTATMAQNNLFQGLTKRIPQNRVLTPYGLRVTFEKTTHIIFPTPIRYVDLGSSNLVAGKAEEADNVLRIKAAVRDFETETNLSVICEDGSLYNFNVLYADEPDKLTIEMADFLYASGRNYPTNRQDIYFKELGKESPVLVKLIMQTIWKNNEKEIKHIANKAFGMQLGLKGLYAHNGLLYFHTELHNKTNFAYKADFISFKIVDKKVAKRTAIQERILQPLRAFNEVKEVAKRKTERSVFVLKQFTLPEDKKLVVTIFEKNGGRTLEFELENEEIIRAKDIEKLKLKL